MGRTIFGRSSEASGEAANGLGPVPKEKAHRNMIIIATETNMPERVTRSFLLRLYTAYI